MNREQTFESKLDDILLKIGWKYFEELNGYRKESNFTIPMWSTYQEKSWDCISVGNYLELKELILQDRERAVQEAMSKFNLKKGVKYDVASSDTVIVITKKTRKGR